MATDYDASLADLVKQLKTSVGSSKFTTNAEILNNVVNPELMNAQDLMNTLGLNITYDRGTIQNILQNAVKADYAAQQKDLGETVRQYYKDLNTNKNTALGTLRGSIASGIQAGASTGANAANVLSTILGMGQQSVDGATTLAQQKTDLSAKENAALADAVGKALTQSNDTQANMATLIRQIYNDQIQQRTGELEYNASLVDSASNRYAADQQLLGNLGNTAGNVYNSNQAQKTSLSNAATEAAASRYAANQALAGQQAYAQGLANQGLAAAQLNAKTAADNTSGLVNIPKATTNTSVTLKQPSLISTAGIDPLTGKPKSTLNTSTAKLKNILSGFGGGGRRF